MKRKDLNVDSTETGYKRKEVSEVLEEKVLRFANEKKIFKTKDLFDANPNNQEYLLRYALLNLRNDCKIFMHGEKKGSYYSISPNPEVDKSLDPPPGVTGLKELIINSVKTFGKRWFKRPEIKINGFTDLEILKMVKNLADSNIVLTRGSLRWTEYSFNDGSVLEEPLEKKNQETPLDEELKDKILDFIKEIGVVTIPMIMEKFDTERFNIVKVLESLCEEEEIWHEGVKRSSKYIHKSVQVEHVEKILSTNREDILDKKNEITDELSKALCGAKIHTFFNSETNKYELKKMCDGSVIDKSEFSSPEEICSYLFHLTDHTQHQLEAVI